MTGAIFLVKLAGFGLKAEVAHLLQHCFRRSHVHRLDSSVSINE